jgi:LacI family transcriptional regulator
MANLTEIAKRTGLSVGTVSRVLNGKNKGTWNRVAKRDKKVRELAVEMGFRPNSAARAVRQGKFQRIACVVTRYGAIGESHSSLNGYTDITADLLAQRGYSVIYEPFHITTLTQQFIEAPRLFSEMAVDGILGFDSIGVVPEYVDERIAEMVAPIVWINRTPTPGITCVNSDEVANARLAVKHLLDLGHRRIAYLGVNEPHYSMIERPTTVMAELRAAGLDTSGLYLAESGASPVEVVQKIFNHQPRYTAMVCFGFRDFFFVLQTAVARGLWIPKDLSVCYFSSPSEVRLFSPCLGTSVKVPEVKMVQKGIDLLLGAIEGTPPAQEVYRIPGEILPGLTTARPADG